MKRQNYLYVILLLAFTACQSGEGQEEIDDSITGSEVTVEKESFIKDLEGVNDDFQQNGGADVESASPMAEGTNPDDAPSASDANADVESTPITTIQLDTVNDLNFNCTSPLVRNDLGSLKTFVKEYRGSEKAGMAIPGFGGLKLGKDELSISAYYIEPKIVRCGGQTKVYAVGYSTHLLVKKMQKGLSLNKLPAVAASMELGNSKTEIMYSFQSYGISGIPIVKFFKPTINKPFDVEGFADMQNSVDGLHRYLSDSALSNQLRFTPMELKFVSATDLE